MFDLDPPVFFCVVDKNIGQIGDLEIMAPACYQIANNTLMNDVIFLVKKKREK